MKSYSDFCSTSNRYWLLIASLDAHRLCRARRNGNDIHKTDIEGDQSSNWFSLGNCFGEDQFDFCDHHNDVRHLCVLSFDSGICESMVHKSGFIQTLDNSSCFESNNKVLAFLMNWKAFRFFYTVQANRTVYIWSDKMDTVSSWKKVQVCSLDREERSLDDWWRGWIDDQRSFGWECVVVDKTWPFIAVCVVFGCWSV